VIHRCGTTKARRLSLDTVQVHVHVQQAVEGFLTDVSLHSALNSIKSFCFDWIDP